MIPPACSAPLKAWQGLAHAEDAQLHPKPCSDFSTFTQSLTHSLPTQNLHWRLHEPCVELSCASDTLASTRLRGTSLCSHRSPCSLLSLWPSASLWAHDWPGGTSHDSEDQWEGGCMGMFTICRCANGHACMHGVMVTSFIFSSYLIARVYLI